MEAVSAEQYVGRRASSLVVELLGHSHQAVSQTALYKQYIVKSQTLLITNTDESIICLQLTHLVLRG